MKYDRIFDAFANCLTIPWVPLIAGFMLLEDDQSKFSANRIFFVAANFRRLDKSILRAILVQMRGMTINRAYDLRKIFFGKLSSIQNHHYPRPMQN